MEDCNIHLICFQIERIGLDNWVKLRAASMQKCHQCSATEYRAHSLYRHMVCLCDVFVMSLFLPCYREEGEGQDDILLPHRGRVDVFKDLTCIKT